MSNTERRKILNYRNANGLSPNPNNIDYGEIAIGYKKDKETIYIKNSTNEIVDFTPISIVNLTYNELKNLRDNSKLKPSQYYRITDFVTTVANDPEARSAGHPFDIIVLALDKNKLHEECHAIQHEGDTYFANCNLAAWKIKYDLDNDTTKYAWADTANGKGVIFYMKDEFNNECPYDFKNIQFKRYKLKNQSGLHLADYPLENSNYANPIKQAFKNWQNYLVSSMNYNNVSFYYTRGVYTSDYLVSGADIYDYDSEYYSSYDGGNLVFNGNSGGNYVCVCGIYDSFDIIAEVEDTNGEWFYTFSKKTTATDAAVDASLSKLTSVVCYNNSIKEYIESKLYYLNNSIFIVLGSTGSIYSNNFNTNCYDNTFGNECYSNSFRDSCTSNSFGNYYYSNSFRDSCTSNSFGNWCNYNSFGNYCNSNSFGNNCNSNSFGNNCTSNSFGNDCDSNSFGNNYNSNSFGNNCTSNSFGNYCHHNSFGDYCNNNTFGTSCNNNSFGNDCDGNTFGNDCSDNTFGNVCNYNTFGNYCQYNTFGNGYYSNTFGNDCQYNTFGNGCNYNSFGNGYYSNTFGNYCQYNSFGNDCSDNTFRDYCNSNSFENYCGNNSFGNYCQYNSFGNYVIYITFEKDYMHKNIVENGNSYITVTSTQTTSSSLVLRNFTIAQGVNNTTTRKTISHNTTNDTFKTTYQNANSKASNV